MDEECIGHEACWEFDIIDGRCRMPKGHEGEHAFYWCEEVDGEKPSTFVYTPTWFKLFLVIFAVASVSLVLVGMAVIEMLKHMGD